MAVPHLAIRRAPSVPRPLTPLIGRSAEAEAIADYLLDDSGHVRIVTLIGPGGIGKTRLALHVGGLLEDGGAFPDGVVFIPLAPLRDPALLLQTVGQALGIYDLEAGSGEQRLRDHLRARRTLIVLDNVEQIIDAAATLAATLAQAPGVRLLITSQLALGISGEQRFPLLPLPTPDAEVHSPEEIRRTPSVELFIQRGMAVRRNLSLDERQMESIAAICRDLEGLPLAIELAAARLNILSPESLLARLSDRLQILSGDRRDVPDRLRTMRHAIAWSYDLLGPGEQWMVRRLSVFAGGIPLEAVEGLEVPAASVPDGEDALTLLEHLVDRSFLRPVESAIGDQRYLMLETIRQFGQEHLAAHPDEERAAREGHADFFALLVDAAAPHLTAPDQATWMRRLDDDLGNIRAALTWSFAESDGSGALTIMSSTWRYWSMRGLASEGRTWMARALELAPHAETPAFVSALNGAGFLAEDQNDLDVARSHFQRARQIASAIGDVLGQAKAATGLGMVAHNRGDYATAIPFHMEAERLAGSIGASRDRASALGNLGAVAYYQGDYERADAVWEECRRLLGQIGDTQSQAMVASNIAAVAMERLDYARAGAMLNEALTLQLQLADSRSIAFTYSNMGDLASVQGDDEQAAVWFAESLALFQRAGDIRHEAITKVSLAEMLIRRGELAEAGLHLVASGRAFLQVSDRLSATEAVDLASVLLAKAGLAEDAARFLGLARRLHRDLDAPVRARLAVDVEAGEARLRTALGEARFARLLESGASLTPDAVFARLETLAPMLLAAEGATPEMAPRPAKVIAPEPAAVEIPPEVHALTERELEVLRLVAQGLSAREIGDRLFISPRTASTHVSNILGKLGVSNRAAAVAIAMRAGIV
ncbi:MAG TPA: tetratricopeptide repeat protein [Thermomicrobiales bacterium]|nr:tetratricopeptide repeat protein [Thermomicrobiales bacterium]